jgi:protein-disulfide isomerase-like protein with CxxC motif
MPAPIAVTHYSDPGCPWAYSASPHLAVLRWRYGDQLAWRNVMIGLAEDPQRYIDRGYTASMMTQGYRRFRRLGMPFATQPKERVAATGRACRAVVAVRLLDPAREDEAFRALQFAQFASTLLFDTDEGLRGALARVERLDADAIIAAIEDDPRVEDAYQSDRAQTRTAAGSPRRRCSSPTPTGACSRPAASSRSRPTTCASPTSTRRSSGGRRRPTRSRPSRPSPTR